MDLVLGSASQIKVVYGNENTVKLGDYSSAAEDDVGSLGQRPLTLQVADVDGDGWADVVASYESTYKRIYYGKHKGANPTSKEDASWRETDATRFGPTSEDSWTGNEKISASSWWTLTSMATWT